MISRAETIANLQPSPANLFEIVDTNRMWEKVEVRGISVYRDPRVKE